MTHIYTTFHISYLYGLRNNSGLKLFETLEIKWIVITPFIILNQFFPFIFLLSLTKCNKDFDLNMPVYGSYVLFHKY